MKSFTYNSLPGKVIFGTGTSRSRLVEEMDRMGVSRILLIATERGKSLVEALCKPLGGRIAGMFTAVKQHVPVEIAEEANIGMKEENLNEAINLILTKAPNDREVSESGCVLVRPDGHVAWRQDVARDCNAELTSAMHQI